MMKDSWLTLIVAIALMGCQTNNSNFQKTESSSPSVTPETLQPSSSVSKKQSPMTEDFLISERGIGSAQLGMTFQQLKQKLGTETQFKVMSPFMVDFDAIAVYQSGQLQYYIIYPSGTTFADSDVIELLLADNPNYRTAEGIGVGTTLQQAQAIYGQAILSYNTQSESREIVRFVNYPSKNIIFLPTVTSKSFAGIYPSSSEEYNETKKFDNSAKIKSILIGR